MQWTKNYLSFGGTVQNCYDPNNCSEFNLKKNIYYVLCVLNDERENGNKNAIEMTECESPVFVAARRRYAGGGKSGGAVRPRHSTLGGTAAIG